PCRDKSVEPVRVLSDGGHTRPQPESPLGSESFERCSGPNTRSQSPPCESSLSWQGRRLRPERSPPNPHRYLLTFSQAPGFESQFRKQPIGSKVSSGLPIGRIRRGKPDTALAGFCSRNGPPTF